MPGGPFMGREREAMMLQGALSPGLYSFAVMRGEAGAGKSTMLELTAARAGVRIVWAAGVEAECRLPFSGLNQLLLPLTPAPDSLPLRDRDVLGQIMGEGSGGPLDVLAVGNAVIALLAASGPLFIAVDDGHWFDLFSADVCAFVFRRVGIHGVRGVVTVRADIPSAFDDAGLPEVEIGPLAAEAAAALLDHAFPELDQELRGQVLTQAEGNPLALLELPRAASNAGLVNDFVPSLPLTRRLEALYSRRITELTPASRHALLLAALDGPASRAVPRHRKIESVLRDSVDAIQRGLLLANPISGKLGFRHSLVRSAVVQLATSNERRTAHAELAALYPDDVERQAAHLSAATIEPDERAALVLERAARSATRRGAATTAVDWLERSAELSVNPAERERRLGEASFVAAQSARLWDAHRLLDGSSSQSGLSAGSARAALMESYSALYRDGDVHAAHHRLASTIDRMGGDMEDGLLNRLLNLLLGISQFAGDAKTWSVTEGLLDRFSSRIDRNALIYRDAWGDLVRRGSGVRQRLRQAFAAASDAEPWDVMRLTVAAYHVDALNEFRPYLHRMVEREGEAGAISNVMTMLHVVMLDQINTGQWTEAEATGQRGLELTARHGYTTFSYQFRVYLGLVAAARGDSRSAAEYRSAVEAWAGPRGIGFLVQCANAVGALAALSDGDYETAYRFASTITVPGTFAPYVQQASRTLLDLVEAAIHTGREDAARSHAVAAQEAALSALSPRLALITAGALAMTSADADAAARFASSLQLPEAALFPFEESRIRLAYGVWLRRMRQPLAAREHLSRAAEAFDRLGARGWGERARRELRAAGAAFRVEPHSSGAALTVQELQIAELAAGGMTNREIGSRLYLSPRTVGSHLYRIFPKLGITSRAALRDALARLEVESSD